MDASRHRRTAFHLLKDTDIPQSIQFISNCRRQLGVDADDPPAEYEELGLQLDFAIIAVRTAGTILQRHKIELSIQNALRHGIFICVTELAERWSSLSMDPKYVNKQALDVLIVKLKEHTELLCFYISACSSRKKAELEVDYTAEPIGVGSGGTLVFKGTFERRSIAVKRMLKTSVTPVMVEVNLMKETDHHPNIIKHYFLTSCPVFWYVVMELCPATLEDLVLRPEQIPEIVKSFEPRRAFREAISGVHHLHAHNIVHRDIKPTNVLISSYRRDRTGYSYRMVISDFGVCRRLGEDGTSLFLGSDAVRGTRGWCAPEVLRGEVRLDEALDAENLAQPNAAQGAFSDNFQGQGKTRKAVDIFALGLVFYYTLTHGGHPFGKLLERNDNILNDNWSLKDLNCNGKDFHEVEDLIRRMLEPEPANRPSTTRCYVHPFFWDGMTRMQFMHLSSEHFQELPRDPKSPEAVALEGEALSVIGSDWLIRLDQCFAQSLEEAQIQYERGSIQDLLRVFRYHWSLLPPGFRALIGHSVTPDDYITYFAHRFPRLLIHVHRVIARSPVSQSSVFLPYFEP